MRDDLPFRTRHPHLFAIDCICVALLVAVACAAVSQWLGGP